MKNLHWNSTRVALRIRIFLSRKKSTFFIIQTKHIDKFIVINFMVRHTNTHTSWTAYAFRFRGFLFYGEIFFKITFVSLRSLPPRKFSFPARTLRRFIGLPSDQILFHMKKLIFWICRTQLMYYYCLIFFSLNEKYKLIFFSTKPKKLKCFLSFSVFF